MIKNLCFRNAFVALAIGGIEIAAGGCDGGELSSRAARGLRLGTPATLVATVPTHLPSVLTEMSGAAMSRTQPGVFFTINDSGNDPLLFALDTAGMSRGEWRVAGVNVDWEAVSIGPCAGQAPATAPACVYIGDVGDNEAMHPNRAIYRVLEPQVRDSGVMRGLAHRADPVLSPERVVFTYPDGRHDVEAMYVAPNGDTFLITKRALRGGMRLRPALVFRLRADVWRAHRATVAELVDSLPIIPGSEPFRTITDASLSSDAKHLAVRTYAQVYVFATDSATGRVDHAVAPDICDITGADEAQGEGVTWMHDGGPLLLTSEGEREPLRVVRCE